MWIKTKQNKTKKRHFFLICFWVSLFFFLFKFLCLYLTPDAEDRSITVPYKPRERIQEKLEQPKGTYNIDFFFALQLLHWRL